MGAYYFLLVIGIILTVVFITLLILADERPSSNYLGGILLFGLFAMAAWAGFFYGVGDRHGANAVARDQYKTYYLYDKDGNVTDTIAKWNNGN